MSLHSNVHQNHSMALLFPFFFSILNQIFQKFTECSLKISGKKHKLSVLYFLLSGQLGLWISLWVRDFALLYEALCCFCLFEVLSLLLQSAMLCLTPLPCTVSPSPLSSADPVEFLCLFFPSSQHNRHCHD